MADSDAGEDRRVLRGNTGGTDPHQSQQLPDPAAICQAKQSGS